MTTSGIDVSVVIVSWNTRDVLRDCLQSIREKAGRVTCEVIVIDNNSADGSADMVAAEFPDFRLIRNRSNGGFASANNQGIAISNSRYVLLLNPDTLIRGAAITKSVHFADSHPDAAVVGCKTYGGTGCMQYNCYLYPSLLNVALSLSHLQTHYWYHPFFGRARLGWWDYDSPREVEAVAGCFMLVRRTAIDQVGPMSDEYFMYSEDTEWCWRFKQAGWKIMYTPDAVITHFGQCSSSQAARSMRLMERQSLLVFLEKKSGKFERFLANGMFAAASFAKLPWLYLKKWTQGARDGDALKELNLCIAALRFHLLGKVATRS
ncbi:MAG: glycosyltransferase family 2 protein [Planctomycetes bacterium]|nr:glycosyltransferase family 2 protein [Planctomycetota bacterium]MBI3833259.1 glycosyltransferase family 2 protein [Planctomycetota bacterium]